MAQIGVEPPGDGFWQFSLAFYASAGVAESLIDLQDRAGFDVNLILFALWLGLSGRRPLDANGLAAAEAAVRAIRSGVVEPLRHMRRALKPHQELDLQELRARIKELELAAEKAAQYRLAAIAGPVEAGFLPLPERLDRAGANLALYLGSDQAGGAAARRLRLLLAEFAGSEPAARYSRAGSTNRVGFRRATRF